MLSFPPIIRRLLPVRATRTWLGPQGPHAPSNLGKGGINNNNSHHNVIERHQEYARRIASRHVTKQGEPHGVVLIQAAMLEAQ